MLTNDRGPLRLDADELVACVACGLCLPHCPTYRATGLEIASPRGRIAAMRLVELEGAPIDDAFMTAMNECVQCRGCEAACPSSVQFGHLMEDTRAALHERSRSSPSSAPLGRRVVEWIGYRVVLPHHALLLAVTWLAWLAQRVRALPRRLALPPLSARSLRKPLDAPTGGDPSAWIFTGCVMDAWLRDTHRSTVTLMHAAGADVARPGRGGDCCGALHVHAGRTREARRLAWRVMRSMPGDAPIVVNSAGCGAAMKDYGRLIGTAAAEQFSARVRDFSEWLDEQPALPLRATGETLVVQDPCHLRHVQRAQGAVRRVLAPAYSLAETDDDGLCCGAGGVYALLQPELSSEIRTRKVAALRRAAPDPVAVSANPGCIVHLRQAGIDARHPADLLADALAERPHE
jgi:glycolate oxidase iron-sulfur subunit